MKVLSILLFSSVSSQLQLSYINKISNALGNHNARRRPLMTLSDPMTSQEEELFQKIISFDNSYRKHIENIKKHCKTTSQKILICNFWNLGESVLSDEKYWFLHLPCSGQDN